MKKKKIITLYLKLPRHLRNRKHFPCFHTVIETRVEVWENVGRISRSPKLPLVFPLRKGTREKTFSISFIK